MAPPRQIHETQWFHASPWPMTSHAPKMFKKWEGMIHALPWMFVLYLMPVSCACDCVVCQNLRRLHLLDIHCSNSTAVILVHHIFPKMQKLGNMDLADPSGSMQTKLPANVPAVAPKEKPRIGEPFSNLIWTLVSMQRWKIGRFTLVNRPLRLQPRRSTDTWPSDRLKIHEFYRGWSVQNMLRCWPCREANRVEHGAILPHHHLHILSRPLDFVDLTEGNLQLLIFLLLSRFIQRIIYIYIMISFFFLS